VLARAAGIPSRLAIGYITGYYDYELECYVVAERDAHSWPEVYFGEYGWIAFEPTAAYATLTRPRDPFDPAAFDPTVRPPPERPWNVAVREWWRRVRQVSVDQILLGIAVVGGGLAIVALLVLLSVRLVRAYRRSKLSPVQGVALCYAEMLVWGEQLGAARRPQDTPAEYAHTLAATIQARAARWPWSAQKLVPEQDEAAHDADTLSQAYQRASYHPQSVTHQERARIDRLWERLQRQMRRLTIASRT
jgi:hypothetical protein